MVLAAHMLPVYAVSFSQRRSMALHEKRSNIPSDFEKLKAADLESAMKFRIGLKPRDMAGLEKAFYDVSVPGNPLYGRHLSVDEVQNFTSASPESVSAVREWLDEHGITDVEQDSSVGNWLSFSAPISKANDLFDTTFHSFINKRTNELSIRTLEYSIPHNLAPHIEVVHPTVSFGTPAAQSLSVSVSRPRPHRRTLYKRDGKMDSSCTNTITPKCLQSLYGIPNTPATHPSNQIAVPGLIDYWAQNADLETFLKQVRPDMPSNTTFAVEMIDGGSNPQGPDKAAAEANLDIQYTVGLATGVPVTFISVGNETADDSLGFLDVVEHLMNKTSPPQVMSMSYGMGEDWISPALAQRICNSYMALGARGVSLIFASGDGGVGDTFVRNDTCFEFSPPFPGGCPYITSVGGTAKFSPEVGAELSTGGFSNVFARPSYQDSSVPPYLEALGNIYAGRFNASGRGYPDVAAQAVDVGIVNGGQNMVISGTSASAPIFASVIALVNDRLAQAGKSPLGFLNPFLYANPQMFNDITSGSNPGCGTVGFNATKGWDPITGLGTPRFAQMLAAAGVPDT
ncbi:hypothetical protein QCA50_013132 [Cerrena zonata]|uniref:tripeptidyl-peptidase II n=1 Tax=Cerrena zonata TaxID=2478898 RepID=A0AAW0FSD6_9APHY